jgi:chromosomal replication initiation ATPase DnaA
MDEVLQRYLDGEPVLVLARETGLSPSVIRYRVHRAELSGERLTRKSERCALRAAELRHAAIRLVDIDILTPTRRPRVVLVRHAVMAILRAEGYSLPDIAVAVGLVCHTTVLHGLRRAEACPDRQAMRQRLEEFTS